ncbi:ankyrin repeat protein, putative [Trichomonas vaginalis G3]|uniref:Ankyrin repeat protein, putative n=1 Tax=Trichomonas vaginalis (strain ATCC PRA-98 / G3) TaxID=412133 RepID=A2DA99_TRIV3|nr:spectrin binding [Trichomonas vaginalis G3]EAY22747.1 ankyrin repeat protein, putative [Trichomonas vaginalis G3]KAI5525558.1 spectrin binding [Trichomonas vaginalis G3]|eukprot:XP_001583733.1 ankyrin repeat protein [Trichomonas vaginalis G3]
MNQKKRKLYDSYEFTLDVHKENTIWKALIDDDLKALIPFTEENDFNPKRGIKSQFYPKDEMEKPFTLIEFCCFHGSVNCFKFLRTKFNLKITFRCVNFSMLSGVPDIMSECLKVKKPGLYSMKYAIISHNIDFVSFLMNEHDLVISMHDCYNFNNLQAYLVYLDQTQQFDKCFIYSPAFNLPPLFDYLIAHGASINPISTENKTALYIAAKYGFKTAVEYLIAHGANVNIKTLPLFTTPLHEAAIHDYPEIAEILILHGAEINAISARMKTPLHRAIQKNSIETAKVLILHGADVNATGEDGETVLHYAADKNRYEIAELLIAHGANVNAQNDYGDTPLNYAYTSESMEVINVLKSHGALDSNDD